MMPLTECGLSTGRSSIITEHHDTACKVFPPQHFGRREASGASSNDYDSLGRIAGGLTDLQCLRLATIVSNEYMVVP